MFGMLIAYDELGNIIQTRDFQVVYDPVTGAAISVVDYLAAEAAGIENTAFWNVRVYDTVTNPITNERTRVLRVPQPVIGSKAWPEWIGGAAHQFRVELTGLPGQRRIGALIHKNSGHRRERVVVETAIADRIAAKVAEAKARGDEMRAEAHAMGMSTADVALILDPEPEPADIRDLVGGPDKPLQLDADGRTKQPEPPPPTGTPPLPVIRVKKV